MLRKLKKLYFKIYHLFKLIGIFIIVFGLKENVYAEECNNLYKGEKNLFNREIDANTNWLISSKTGSTDYLTSYRSNCDSETTLCLDGAKDYTIYALKNNEQVDMNITGMTNVILLGNTWLASFGEKKSLTRKGNVNGDVWRYTFNKSNLTQSIIDEINSWDWYVVEGTEVCIPTITPPTPPGPQPNEAYTNFIALYTNRLNYLAEGFTSNSYLIAMIGIIIAWVVLELALKLFNLKGGYKK